MLSEEVYICHTDWVQVSIAGFMYKKAPELYESSCLADETSGTTSFISTYYICFKLRLNPNIGMSYMSNEDGDITVRRQESK